MRRIRQVMAAGGVLTLLATGCGTDSRPSEAEFAKNVREVCSKAQVRHDAAAKGFDFEAFDPDRSDLSTIAPVIERNVAIGRDAVRELSEIRGPRDEEARIRRFVATAKRVHRLGDEEARAARRGDRPAFKRLIAREDALQSELGDDPDLEGC